MFLLHPPIPPWLDPVAGGWRVSLLLDGEATAGVFLHCTPDNEARLIPMRPAGRCGALRRFDALLPIDHGNPVTLYAFKVLGGDGQRWLAADGQHAHVPAEAECFRANPDDRPPTWVREQVFYEIFPDRFARSGAPRDRRGETVYGSRPRPVVQKAWGEPPDPAQASNTFYGGDLRGILDRLDYLQHELGVTALYLTPVFASGSNHKYDVEDYTRVDPDFGGNAALADLCAAARSRGMRIVLDAVLNHTGTNHPWFNRWGRHPVVGAYQSTASPWRDWYAFDAEGSAVGWNGHASLPILDYRAAGPRAAVYEAPDAILRLWLRAPYAIDGWRLDAVHMVGEGPGSRNNAAIVRAFRQAIKEENGEAYVLGEHFGEATRWLQGDQEDGAMNYYGFAQPACAWLAGRDAQLHRQRLPTADFERWLLRAMAAIPFDNQLAQLNLLDSHDTPRLLTLLDGDVAGMQIAATLLFAWPGVPCIYYGDEIGMQGGADPDCRRCFDWDRDRWQRDLFAHYRALVALRKARAEWRHGAYLPLAVADDCFAFARYTAEAASIVVANRGDAIALTIPAARLPLPAARWRDGRGASSSPRADTLTVEVPPRSAIVLLAEI